MIFNIATLFPNIIENIFSESIIKRAIDNGIIELNAYNYRDYTSNKHKNVDDTPYGGGAGMVMQIEPVQKTIEYIKNSNIQNQDTHIIMMSPRGKVFNQKDAIRLTNYDSITFLCGHYEGFDERIIEKYVDEEISIGDFVLTGGELPAACIVDSITRLLDGVLAKDSLIDESFSNDLLEYPQYTKPEIYENMRVPKVLLSGNHAEIKKWRYEQSIKITKDRRMDLYEKYIDDNK